MQLKFYLETHTYCIRHLQAWLRQAVLWQEDCMTGRWKNSAVIRQARRDELFPHCRIVCYRSGVSSSDIHGTCPFPGEDTGASLADHEWLKMAYLKKYILWLAGEAVWCGPPCPRVPSGVCLLLRASGYTWSL